MKKERFIRFQTFNHYLNDIARAHQARFSMTHQPSGLQLDFIKPVINQCELTTAMVDL